MIRRIGIDSVEIQRFEKWYQYDQRRLTRIFKPQEISYCLQHTKKSAERFAAHFATKEALFKSLNLIINIPFLTLCKQSTLSHKDNGEPYIILDKQITERLDKHSVHISITHTKTIATVIVILE